MHVLRPIVLVALLVVVGCKSTKTTNQDDPVDTTDLVELSPVRALTAGYAHACALMQEGSIWCWGETGSGVLGNNPDHTSGSTRQDRAVRVVSDEKYMALSAGEYHNCAISESGDVWCWGSNLHSALGLGDNEDRGSPTRVEGLPTSAQMVAAGATHTCALLKDESVFCWGTIVVTGDEGALGGRAEYASPVSVPHLDGHPVSLVSGSGESCVLMREGNVYCWGIGRDGPQEVDFGTDVSSIALDYDTINNGTLCIYDTAGVVKCGHRRWDEPALRRSDLERVGAVEDLGARKLAFDSAHTCVLTHSGQVWCWGANTYGQLGTGDILDRQEPYHVEAVTQATDIAVGGSFSCAAQGDGQVLCWGKNDSGQTGSPGPRVDRVRGLDEPAIRVANGTPSCAVLESGTIKCWGQWLDYDTDVDSMDLLMRTVDGLNGPAVDVEIGDGFACALLESGTVQCWGSNEFGGLANPSLESSTVPMNIDLTSPADTLSVGSVHACAILQGGSVQCWGDDIFNQLGDDADMRVARGVVTDVVDLRAAALQISAGYSSTCALLADTTVQCWGGLGAYEGLATDVAGLNQPALAVAAANKYACIVLDSGFVECLGSDIPGLDHFTDYTTLTEIDGLQGDVATVSLGTYYACALHSAGDVSCWGTDPLDFSSSNAKSEPHSIDLPEDIQQISVGHDSACFLGASGDVYCNDAISSQRSLTEVGAHWSPTPVVGIQLK